MTSAGRILIMPKGEYNASVTYENLDLVYHGGTSWLAKKTVTGIEPSGANSEYWHKMSEIEIANDLTSTDAGKALDARQGKVLNEKKQERRTHSVTLNANNVYTHAMGYGESGLLFVHDPGMEYAAIFACCGVNESAYSITKLNESSYANIIASEIGTIGGSNINRITFTNNTNSDRQLTFVILPFNN